VEAVRIRRLLVAAFALALVAAPVARLAAAAPCAAPMDCCAGMGDDAAAPCQCSLNPVPPAPAAIDRAHAPAAVVPAEAPLPAVEAEVPATAGPAARVAPRARAAPLHLLYSVFLV